jgi:Tfp pilus assembly protein PilN
MGILFFAAALLMLLYVVLDRQKAAADVAAAQAQSATLIAPFKAKDGVESDKAARLIAVQDDLDQAFEPGQHLTDISGVVTDCLPSGAWLTGISLERDKPLQLHGTALAAGDVAKLVDALGSSDRLKNVKLIFANSATIGTTPVVQFDVTADCIGNLPIPTPPKSETGGFVTTSATTSSDEGTGG